MRDMKRLCKRDRIYWLIMALIMLGLTAYMTFNVMGDFLNETRESVRRAIVFCSEHPEAEKLAGELNKVWLPVDIIWMMMTGILGVSFAGQAVRMLLQETKNREEVMNLFPVKSRSRLTYYYVSGLITIGVSYAVKTGIIFMLHISLLILCRRLTNHIAGTIFTFIVVELAMYVSVGRCLGWYWDNLLDNRVWCWIFWAVMAAAFIILSYIADRNKDYARNGFYASPAVHRIMMGIIFAEGCYVFYGTYENIPKLLLYMWVFAASVLITAGVHFLTKPKSI